MFLNNDSPRPQPYAQRQAKVEVIWCKICLPLSLFVPQISSVLMVQDLYALELNQSPSVYFIISKGYIILTLRYMWLVKGRF